MFWSSGSALVVVSEVPVAVGDGSAASPAGELFALVLPCLPARSLSSVRCVVSALLAGSALFVGCSVARCTAAFVGGAVDDGVRVEERLLNLLRRQIATMTTDRRQHLVSHPPLEGAGAINLAAQYGDVEARLADDRYRLVARRVLTERVPRSSSSRRRVRLCASL